MATPHLTKPAYATLCKLLRVDWLSRDATCMDNYIASRVLEELLYTGCVEEDGRGSERYTLTDTGWRVLGVY